MEIQEKQFVAFLVVQMKIKSLENKKKKKSKIKIIMNLINCDHV